MRQREILIRIVLVLLLLYALGHFSAAQLTLRRTERLTAELQNQRDALLGEQRLLREERESLRTPEGLEAAARERLGLVRPGERVFYVIEGEDPAQPPE